MKYAVVYEKTNTGYSAYLPDLPGCIATGTSLELTKRRMGKAVEKHLAAMHADGDPIPEPVTEVAYIETPPRITGIAENWGQYPMSRTVTRR